MFWSRGCIDLDRAGRCNNAYIRQNSSNRLLKIHAFVVGKFALIFKSLRNTYCLFLVSRQVREETREMYTVEGLWNYSPHVITSFHRFPEVLPGIQVDRRSSLSLPLVRFLIRVHPDLGIMTRLSGPLHR